MKVILGVDAQAAHKPAICLLSRLHPAKREMLLVHAADVSTAWSGAYSDAYLQAEYTKSMQNVGLTALDEARSDSCAHDFHAKTRLVLGSPAHSLITEGEKEHADLIAVNSTHKGAWSASFLGSISRALAIACPISILVTKGERRLPANPRVVFATDHSDYANQALDRFLQFRFDGISEVIVLTAFELDENQVEVMSRGLPELGTSVSQLIETRMMEKTKEVCDKLAQAGYRATPRVVQGPVNDAIRNTMQDAHADLLVLGAQGHGFLSRLLVGSTSLHQVVAEPYPVMVVRP
jgi:nucleotide-binding universal stress UspA family protein